ncbi:MAG: aldo/keto reductase [Verrucomicrobiales bacterium]|nr:aldo/keto reductase [Verrucomicrobiales bacterium]
MEISRTTFGTWNGGRFMNYGEPLAEERWIQLVRSAHSQGVRTFLTADVYGNGAADTLLGRALEGLPRDSYCLVGMVGHDFYSARRDGAKGYPRFSDPQLRSAVDYGSYLRMATEKSLERCRTDHFDVLLLHNPDQTGYSSDSVWKPMDGLREAGLAERIGVAPGPANGFTLDMILCFERFGSLIDWAMIILNPFEPWPGSLVLPAAAKNDVKVLTRVVDYGGIFHDDVKPGHTYGTGDHRAFRPAGWIESANDKLDRLRPIIRKYGVTPLQFACGWCLRQPAVKSVVPTLIQEVGSSAKRIEDKLAELATLPDLPLDADELATIASVGDNTGCMHLKGAYHQHTTAPVSDQWGLNPDLEAVGRRWSIDPRRDLVPSH